MKSDPRNPPANSLPAGIVEADLVNAISSSGYPLQGVVAAGLLPYFKIVEEWGFVDDETKEHRSLDIYGYRVLSEQAEAGIHAGMMLLVECKRSRHPFIFFRQVVSRTTPQFPSVHGIPRRVIEIYERGSGRMTEASPAMALGLDRLPFVAGGPPICASFSKAIPSGKRVDLSGAEPFNTVILPLIGALKHAVAQARSPARDAPIFPTLAMCVAVLDAPMLIVEAPEESDEPVLCPWTRVVRHEAFKDQSGQSASRFYGIDFVHSAFLHTFLDEHLLPFAEAFASRAKGAETILRYGGDVPSLEEWSWEQVTPRGR